MKPISPDMLAAGSGVVDWLLGLERINWSDPKAAVTWQWALPAWMWVVLVLVAMAAAGWSYRRLLGRLWGRVALAGVRTLTIVLVAALLLGPQLTVIDQQVEQDWLFMLVDRSESMSIEDALGPGASAESADPVSRDAAMRAQLLGQAAVFEDEGFVRHRRVVWLGFDQGTYEISPPTDSAWAAPQGQTTAVRTAIEQALQRAAGRPVAGIVLFSDGRSAESTDAALVRQLRGVPVFAVPLGGDVSPVNFRIAQVDAPQRAFINDDVPVRVIVDREPQEFEPGAAVNVRLIDEQTGRMLDEQVYDPAADGEPLTLIGRAVTSGPAQWRAEVVYDSPTDSRMRDPKPQDNTRTVDIEMLDQELRVLLVDGYPRWEYRYLKNLLVREKTVRSSILLVVADRDFAQEGDEPINYMPLSPEDWSRYDFDVVVLGDVPPDYMSADQMSMLADHVSVRGAGLLWIAGPYHTPHGYDGTALADLLPMRQPGAVVRAATAEGVSLRPWPLADALRVLQLRDPAANADETWPDDLAAFYWVQDVGPLKQTAEVIAASADPGAADDESLPLIMRMRYGAGQSVYIATDETWRWRMGRGERYFGQFWIGLIRMLGRHRIQNRIDGVSLSVPHQRVETNQNVVVTLEVDDALLLKRDLSRIAVAVQRVDDPFNVLEQFELHPVEAGGGAVNSSASPPRASYQANWRPTHVGELRLRVSEPALDHLDIHQSIEVVGPDAEMRYTAPDHKRLEQLAADSGGKVIAADRLDELAEVVPHVYRAQPDDESEPLWNSPLALLLVLGLLTGEWVGRKLVRLI